MADDAPPPPEAQPPAPIQTDAADGAHKPKRSWRRKYRKMRAKFEDTMSTSNTLIRDEFRAEATARRLQEQNDQILDVLLDMNENVRLPAHLRFDLRELTDIDSSLPTVEVEADPEAVQKRVQELREDMVKGIITPEEFARKSDQLHASQTIITNRTLSGLEAKVPHTTEVPDPAPEGLVLGEHAPAYMTPAHEEEYLHALDMALADPSYEPNAHDGRPIRTTVRPLPSDKELTIQNPDSVYNWLRKHQPQVFLQDKDPTHNEYMSEKSNANAKNWQRGKRHSAAATSTPVPKADQDVDDEGYMPETGKSRRGKGEDDTAYRPKGGSSRPPKRKREDGDTPAGGKGSRKKGRASAGGALAQGT